MNIRLLHAPADPALSRALAHFEQDFSYPLGPDLRFSISHGDDYARFFRAMGEAQCFVAERNGKISGVVAAAIRRVALPDGTEREACYLGDLKIAPQERGGRTLFELARSVRAWLPQSVTTGFAVVMDGTGSTPNLYTGRAGLPAFTALSHIVVARFGAINAKSGNDLKVCDADPRMGLARFRDLSRGRYWTPPGDAHERSACAPEWLINHDGSAIGRLEDTRLAKRLILDDGAELVSAHLSCFAYRDGVSGAALVRSALHRARQRGFPAMWVSLPASQAAELLEHLAGDHATLAPATVFGHGLTSGVDWNINTADI